MSFLLMHWKLVAVALVVVTLGSAVLVQTERLEDLRAEYDAFRMEVAAAGREAKAKAEAVNAHQQLVNEELEHDIQTEREARAKERAERSARFGALYGKYLGLLHADPGGGRVPEAAAGTAEPVQGRVCFNRDRFAGGVRADLDALYSETEQLLERGGGAVDAALFWGKWARLTGACQKQ